MEKLEVNLLDLQILAESLYSEIGMLRKEVEKLKLEAETLYINNKEEAELSFALDTVKYKLTAAEQLYIQIRDLEDYMEKQA